MHDISYMAKWNANWELKKSVSGCRGKDVSMENMQQGYTHIFESTFESTEGIAEYVAHPAHVDYANRFLPQLDKVIIIDYKPTTVHLWELVTVCLSSTSETE